jgi:hypothetical protein
MTAAGRQHDVDGWNYGSAWPPSYGAFGRLRVLSTLNSVLALKPQRVLEVAAGDGALSACLAARGSQRCGERSARGRAYNRHRDLMGSPFITGHCGFSIINYRQLARLCYWFEEQSRRLPLRFREKICFCRRFSRRTEQYRRRRESISSGRAVQADHAVVSCRSEIVGAVMSVTPSMKRRNVI